eukprot:TRINITY_DN3313_c0_g2_i6.p1 TRINITY_DN3313_c0_g2~~TRINITY_DN3313_c0_g2_i6.p1  ORF type:complete len:161 (+),score=19.03 TRINITY_DN3313_c0_g2_i6:119-601(+)
MGLLLLIAAVLLPEIHAATGTCGHAMQGQQLAALGYVGRWNSGTATPNIQEFLKAAGNVAEYTSQNPAELFWAVQGADSAANYGTLVAVCAVNEDAVTFNASSAGALAEPGFEIRTRFEIGAQGSCSACQETTQSSRGKGTHRTTMEAAMRTQCWTSWSV